MFELLPEKDKLVPDVELQTEGITTSMLKTAEQSFLNIDPISGTISLTRDLRKEDIGMYRFRVMVKDMSEPIRNSSVRFLVRVANIPPRIVFGPAIPLADKPSSQRVDSKVNETSFLTNDGVLVVALALVMLLLLVTLSLVIYARYWHSRSVPRSPTTRGSGFCPRWFKGEQCTSANPSENGPIYTVKGIPPGQMFYEGPTGNLYSVAPADHQNGFIKGYANQRSVLVARRPLLRSAENIMITSMANTRTSEMGESNIARSVSPEEKGLDSTSEEVSL
ncbi:hypothetical protein Ciccas_014136 [Cichlidogyrus casuarinus]|uniref:Cadherin domain-containing protein n=1 Tax=Cichlidogyrus casuarinus TaxID=1844966 RepID=A0ABD2PJG0_9PLAT